MTVSTGIIIGGLLSVALAIFHCSFYNFFNWKDDLKNVSALNGRLFMTLHIGFIVVFLFFAFLSFAYTEELSQCNGLAGIITGFYASMWLFRTVWQVTYLKQFKKEHPVLHYLLIVWFLVLLAAYTAPVAVKFL